MATQQAIVGMHAAAVSTECAADSTVAKCSGLLRRCRVDIECIGSGTRGAHYRVWYDGTVIVEHTRDPEHDAARTLFALGITGSMETWRHGALHPSMKGDIASTARMSVSETVKSGPRTVAWRPFERPSLSDTRFPFDGASVGGELDLDG